MHYIVYLIIMKEPNTSYFSYLKCRNTLLCALVKGIVHLFSMSVLFEAASYIRYDDRTLPSSYR